MVKKKHSKNKKTIAFVAVAAVIIIASILFAVNSSYTDNYIADYKDFNVYQRTNSVTQQTDYFATGTSNNGETVNSVEATGQYFADKQDATNWVDSQKLPDPHGVTFTDHPYSFSNLVSMGGSNGYNGWYLWQREYTDGSEAIGYWANYPKGLNSDSVVSNIFGTPEELKAYIDGISFID